jgi:hypothetical protein
VIEVALATSATEVDAMRAQQPVALLEAERLGSHERLRLRYANRKTESEVIVAMMRWSLTLARRASPHRASWCS